MEMKIKNSGGRRLGAGPKQKYNEPTVMVSFRCPISKVEEFKKSGNEKLDKWKTGLSKVSVSGTDERLMVLNKYAIKKLLGKLQVCRHVESARGKFNVLLAQDIIGINCEIKFIDGNTMNNERDNIQQISRNVEYFY